MQYRPFGRSGWSVSEIAFGGWQIGGGWGEVDDADSVQTLLHAYESGINFVDTAQYYGDGRSEEVIGRSLKEWSGERIYVATKVQPIQWPDAAEDAPLMRGRYPSWYLREAVDASLGRLAVDRLDLLQLHCWLPDGIRSLDWLETLNELRIEGKVDQIGVSIRDYRPDEGLGLVQLGLVNSIQVVFNLFEQRPTEQLFPAAAASQTACIARVPFDSGSLIGNWTPNTYAEWPAGSVPHTLFRGDRFAETLKRVEKLKEVVLPHYATLAEAAMRYVLSESQVSTVIPGMRNEREVDLNVAYSDGHTFSPELRQALTEHQWPRNFYR